MPWMSAAVAAGGNLLGSFMTNSANSSMLGQQQGFNAAMQGQAENFNQANMFQNEAYNRTNMYQAEAFQANQVNAAEAYNTQMADTTAQRKVADLQAAGLNPMLAGVNQQGAPAPTAQPASVNAPSGTAASIGATSSPSSPSRSFDIGSALNSGIQALNASQDLSNKVDQGQLLRDQAQAAAGEAANKAQANRSLKSDADVAQATQDWRIKQAAQALASSAASQALDQSRARLVDAQTAGQGSENVGLKNEADYQAGLGPLGKWIDHSLNAIGSAGKAFRSFTP